MWIKGLSVLLSRKHNPEMAFIKNAWKKQKSPDVNLREVIGLLGKLNYQSSKRQVKMIFLGVDVNAKRRLNFNEFLKLLASMYFSSSLEVILHSYSRASGNSRAIQEIQLRRKVYHRLRSCEVLAHRARRNGSDTQRLPEDYCKIQRYMQKRALARHGGISFLAG